ncbi:hypothetical protein [Amycolatopsis sp. CA-230715]|uniref:hypothetical protein n=1 Tax=Amycolatopsis sp. CA-230715 TaxID=2745196 RepID=UPI001C3393FA|nr:hypothetical protein [Amycolatopsis sp. CA-230715]QWF81280.1 hypothetical protein HUW46_04710 [Amycolatopsis sp. CA-230715]
MVTVRETTAVRPAAGCASRPLARDAAPAPFMVVGLVNGHEVAAAVPSPAAAVRRLLDWLTLDDDASAVWYLREDWPEPVTVVARMVSGAVGETRRTAHLFQLLPGDVQCGPMIARCGTELCPSEVEWLRLGAGMPCEQCLAAASAERRALEAVAG